MFFVVTQTAHPLREGLIEAGVALSDAAFELSAIASRLARASLRDVGSTTESGAERGPERGPRAAVAAILRDAGAGAPVGRGVEVLLIRRAEREGYSSGHMAFPGGRPRTRWTRISTPPRCARRARRWGFISRRTARSSASGPDLEAVARAKRTGLMITPFASALHARNAPTRHLRRERRSRRRCDSRWRRPREARARKSEKQHQAQQRDPGQPGQFPGLSVRVREHDTEHVHECDEYQQIGGPAMDGPDQPAELDAGHDELHAFESFVDRGPVVQHQQNARDDLDGEQEQRHSAEVVPASRRVHRDGFVLHQPTYRAEVQPLFQPARLLRSRFRGSQFTFPLA